MDSAVPGFSERASPDRGPVGAKPAQSGETAYLREDELARVRGPRMS